MKVTRILIYLRHRQNHHKTKKLPKLILKQNIFASNSGGTKWETFLLPQNQSNKRSQFTLYGSDNCEYGSLCCTITIMPICLKCMFSTVEMNALDIEQLKIYKDNK